METSHHQFMGLTTLMNWGISFSEPSSGEATWKGMFIFSPPTEVTGGAQIL